MFGLGIASLMVILSPLFIVITGQSRIIGWDEFAPISTWLQENTEADDTILVLPAYDTNANLYAHADRQPPYYMKTWSYHASVPANAERLTQAVMANPPILILDEATSALDSEQPSNKASPARQSPATESPATQSLPIHPSYPGPRTRASRSPRRDPDIPPTPPRRRGKDQQYPHK